MMGQSPQHRGEGQHIAPSKPPALAIPDRAGASWWSSALLLSSNLPPEVRRAVSGLGQTLGSLAVSAACMYRFRLSTGRRRHAWLFFAIAGFFGAAGAVGLWAAKPGGAGDPTSPANAFITLALISGVAGIVLYPSVPRRFTEMVRIVLDGVVLGGSILYIASLTVFPQILANSTTPYPQRLLPLASPVVELVIATVAALLYWRAAPADRTSLGLAAIGFALYAVSATALAVQTAQGDFMLGSITDLGWIAGHVDAGPRHQSGPGRAPQGRAQGTVAGARHLRHVRPVRGRRPGQPLRPAERHLHRRVGAVADRPAGGRRPPDLHHPRQRTPAPRSRDPGGRTHRRPEHGQPAQHLAAELRR